MYRRFQASNPRPNSDASAAQMNLFYRALEKLGNALDFYLLPTRNAKPAKRFLGKALLLLMTTGCFCHDALKDRNKSCRNNTISSSGNASANFIMRVTFVRSKPRPNCVANSYDSVATICSP